MRILLTADPELPVPPKLYGGIERIIDALARLLRERGHHVGLVAHEDSECPVEEFISWNGKQSQNRADTIRNTVTLLRAVRSFKPDILHSFSRILYMLPLLPSRLPKVMSYQRDPGVRNIQLATRLASRRSLAFTGCSAHICSRGQRGGGEWHPIHNFIELDTYTPRYDTSPEAPLAFLSRIEQIKGTHNAIAIAQQTGRPLLIAGNHAEEGEAGAYWRERVEPHLGKNGIEYIGPVNDQQKNELLGAASAMVVPIEWDEPFGIVFAEALACGTPVISSPRGSLPEIVEQGKHGFLVRSVREGCEAVGKLAEIDRRECRRRAEQYFSSDVIADKYEALYRSMTGTGQEG